MKEMCGTCEGTGTIMKYDDDGIFQWVWCPVCRGTGARPLEVHCDSKTNLTLQELDDKIENAKKLLEELIKAKNELKKKQYSLGIISTPSRSKYHRSYYRPMRSSRGNDALGAALLCALIALIWTTTLAIYTWLKNKY